MQNFPAYVIKIGDGYLWRKHRYSRKPVPFDKARLFFRRSDATQAKQGFDAWVSQRFGVNCEIVPVSIALEA